MFNLKKGLTFIEVVVGVGVFFVVAISIYNAYANIMNFVAASRNKVIASGLSNELFEVIRSLPYEDVGVQNSIPDGILPHVQNLVRNGQNFVATTTIRNIDDPFDGTIGGNPNDLSPADYKLVEIEITCTSCRNFSPIFVNTHVAPKNLETASTNGALFIRVIDANGQPVPSASVHVENNEPTTPIVIDDSTNSSGMLQIVDAPPGVNAYEITVSKSGFTTDQTYAPGAPENPNPLKPHATVALQQVTQITFTIDKESTMNVSSVTNTCSPVGFVDFSLTGTRLIGTDPNVLKFNENHVTNSSGQKVISNLEWDTYTLSLLSSSLDLAGTNPIFPVFLPPNGELNVDLIVFPKSPNSLLVIVKDSITQLPLADASVRLEGSGFDKTLITGRGFISQTDWSGGAGQASSTDPTRYFSSVGIDIDNPAGEIKLIDVANSFVENGELISSTFDTGSPSNFRQLFWQPADQPPLAGENSVKLQIATNNDTETWNFVGPDGTPGTFYTTSNTNISSVHNGDRFLRYKVYLETEDQNFSPNISDISFTFTSSCVPPGQVLFNGLNLSSYNLTVSREGYEVYSVEVDTSDEWQQYEVLLLPSET